MLFGVSPFDPLVLLLAAMCVLLLAVGASVPLALRAADLGVVMAYRLPGNEAKAAIEIYPVSGKKLTVPPQGWALPPRLSRLSSSCPQSSVRSCAPDLAYYRLDAITFVYFRLPS
jgi:hypothetical protein